MNEQAGQATERTPDFIPGWFRRIGTDRKGEQIREAVRIVDASNFPLGFLVSGESVEPSGHGVSIDLRGGKMSLAVPSGYWIVRDGDGAPRNWSHDDFTEQWVRENRLWLPPHDRDGDDLAADDRGWRGTPPAEGTRRHLILGAIREGDVLSDVESLEIADCVEAALIDATIAAEEDTIAHKMYASGTVGEEVYGAETTTTFVAGGEQHRNGPADGYEEEGPGRPDAEIRDSEGNLLGGLEVVVGAADGVPYVSLSDLESVFANLYEDITERQAKKQRKQHGEVSLSGTMQAHDGRSTLRYDDEEEKKIAAKRVVEAALAAEQRVDAEDDRPLWKVELDYGLNHVRNAIAARLGL